MKVTYYQNDIDPSGDQNSQSPLLLKIAELTDQYGMQLPDGWRNAIRIRKLEDDNPHNVFALDVESDIGGGEYANTKLSMLEQFPELYYTGEHNTVKFAILLDKRFAPDSTIGRLNQELRAARTTAQVNPTIWEELQRKYRVTHWYGGIRIPMRITNACWSTNTRRGQESWDTHTDSYEILLAFSGAKEWMDVYIALQIFKELSHNLPGDRKHSRVSYSLTELYMDPLINFHLRNMGTLIPRKELNHATNQV